MNRGINDKKENKALKIIKFAVIAFALVFCGALLLVLFPPTIFLLLAGICVYVMIKNGKKSEQLKQMCTCAVNAQITGFEKREGMDPNNNYNSTSKTLAVYDFMFNNQYFRVKSRDHFYNSSNALISPSSQTAPSRQSFSSSAIKSLSGITVSQLRTSRVTAKFLS